MGKEEAPEPSPVLLDEGPVSPGTGPAPRLDPQRPGLTRAYVSWMVALGGLLTLILALALSLGVLAALNGGQLQYVRPGEFGQLQVQVEGLETRAGVLDEDVASLRTRLNNLEALSGRVGDLEQVAEKLKSNLAGIESSVESLTEQTGDLRGEVTEITLQLEEVGSELTDLREQLGEVDSKLEALEAQSERSQAFLDGLRDLVNGLFQPEGGTE
jgi:septal ring factor EnvC (AmiA/AmiB activator)